MSHLNREPDARGPAGRAWRAPAEAFAGRAAVVACWLVNLKDSGPTPWHDYLLSAVSLKPFDGVAPATKRFDEATHEITVVALNPALPVLNLDKPVTEENKLHLLTPHDQTIQLGSHHANGAAGLYDKDVIAVCEFLAFSMVWGLQSDGVRAKAVWQVGIRMFLAQQRRVFDVQVSV